MTNNQPITPQAFYTLLIAQFALPFIASCIDTFSNQPELSLLDKTLNPSPQDWEITIVLVFGLGLLMVTIGLFLRKEWARKAYIYLFFPTFLIYFLPYMHWIYSSSYAAIFNDLSFVCSGILLTILTIPSLYQPLFEKK